METINIVEYQASYAKAVADMWNRSSSGWMGRDFNSSEDKVKEDEAKDSFHNLYLAISNELVIGYAKLSKYPEEKDVAYIDLLSVDPKFHGKGVGRDLVQQCVLRAAELGYNRIDLFTWAGNTKAMPLYKKCGFFWEKMENNATHLMNFLPMLLNNELIKPYFEYFHWYNDNKRELHIVPDGRLQDGFQLYDYAWEKDGKRLEISFERSGRGIVAIKTPDFAISTFTETAKPVFGDKYKIKYRLQNFSSGALEVELKGEDDAEVVYSFAAKQTLENEAEFEAECYIQPTLKYLHEWETCPGIKTILSINGKRLNLKTGLFIKYPMSAEFRMVNGLVFPGRKEPLFLNVQNHFDVPCAYHLEFPEDDCVSLLKREYDILLKAGERSNLEMELYTKGACLYNPVLKVIAQPQGKQEIEFHLDSHTQLFSPNGMDGKELRNIVQVINGYYYMYLAKTGSKNWGGFSSLYGNSFNVSPPQIGLPYSEEFDTSLPEEYKIEQEGNVIALKTRFCSQDIPGVEFGFCYKLYPNGLMEAFIRVISLPDDARDLFAKLKVGMDEHKLCYEHHGRIVKVSEDQHGIDINDMDRDSLTGNWLFSQTDDSYSAIIWNPEYPAKFGKYWLTWELDMRRIARQEGGELLFARMFLDVFRNCYQVRNVASGMRKHAEVLLPSLELQVNEGNPILSRSYTAKLIQRLDRRLKGKFSLQSLSIGEDSKTVTDEDNAHELSWQIDKPNATQMEEISCMAEFANYCITRKQLGFFASGEVKSYIKDEFLVIDNGIISIHAASNPRLPTLLSLKYKGIELLDSGYPDFGPKSFRNPFIGGINILPGQINFEALKYEKHSTDAVSLQDQFGNKWHGLQIVTEISEYEPLKGLCYRQCFVMHPGIPVLIMLAEIIKGTGWRSFTYMRFNNWWKHESGIRDASLLYQDNSDNWQSLITGGEQLGLSENLKQTAYKHVDCDVYAQMCHISKIKHNIYIDDLVVHDSFSAYDQITETGRHWLLPHFMVLTPQLLSHDSLSALLNLMFSELT